MAGGVASAVSAEWLTSLPQGAKVLAYLPPTLGDTVQNIAGLRELARLRPDLRLVPMAGELGIGLLRLAGFSAARTRPGGVARAWTLATGGFDAVVVPYGSNTIVRQARLARVPVVVGVAGGKVDGLLSLGVQLPPAGHPVLEFWRRALGLPDWDPDTSLDVAAVDGPVVGERTVAFMAGASHPAKRWPLERFRTVAEHVRAMGWRVANTGGPEERGALGEVAHDDWAGVPVVEAAAALARCALLVTNDTGLMHVAGAVGTPVVAVYGAVTPATFSPPGEGHRLFWSECGCPARTTDACAFTCVGATSVAEVVAAVREILEEKSW